MLKETIVLGGTSTGLIIAQELFNLPDWAKMSVSMASLLILAYVTIVVIPALLQKLLDALTSQQKTHNDALDKVCAVHRETTAELRSAIQDQTTAITCAITERRKVTRRKTDGQ